MQSDWRTTMGKCQEKYSDLNEQQLSVINDYCKDDLRKLKTICYSIWGNKGIPMEFYDDLYSDAMKVLVESVRTYDEGCNVKFTTFLTNNVKFSYKQWYRDNFLRSKRNNLELDKDGKIKRDEYNKPIIIKNVSIDDTETNKDDVSLYEKISDGRTIESEISLFSEDEKVNKFIGVLSDVQKKILLMRMDNLKKNEIMEALNISENEYSSAMKSIRNNKEISLFAKNINDGNYKMEVERMEDRVIEISEADNYRMDKYNLYTLLQYKKNKTINCNYILQREPFQWTSEEANRYFCRILSNLPIPEIILCEQKIKGLTISHLIDGLQRLSYAEAFKENRIKIGKKGSERHFIQYKDFKLNENGERVVDEDGFPVYELKVFDAIGKYYKDLPDDLKERFNNFNINVTKFFNCTDEQIADHIRDYNNHSAMNKEQSGMTKISSVTANRIKEISKKNSFFKNCGKFTDNNQTKGKVDRTVAEAIMLIFFRKEWKSELDSIYKFVDERAEEKHFMRINSHLNRLELAIGDNNKNLKDLFTISNMQVWLTVFDEFTKYNLDDSMFVDFLNAYEDNLKDEEIDGVSMNDFKHAQTKKKATVIGKIELLTKLMKDYLHIEDFEEPEVQNISDNDNTVRCVDASKGESTLEFIKNNVNGSEPEIDMEGYKQTLDDLTIEVDNKSKLLEPENMKSMLAMVAYSYVNDVDLDEWIVDYFNRNNDYIKDQKENFLHMVKDLSKFLEVHTENNNIGTENSSTEVGAA